ncbi:MAG: TRAP transporter large permease [Chloroflexota bacterium]
MATTLAVLFFVLMALTVPLCFSMGLGATIALLLDGSIPPVVIVQRMFAGSDSTTLLAIPFYILAGNLMEEAGISTQLVNLARALVGHIRGSFGMVTVVAEYFFSGLSGSTTADVSAIGSLMIPAMRRAGYRAEDSVAIVAAATSMGSLVPPSLGMIVMASVMEISVGALFFAGFVPAAAIAVVLMMLIYFQARRTGMPVGERASWRGMAIALKDSALALLMPVIIFGGILGGLTTATEAGAVACLYAFVVGAFVFRTINLPALQRLAIKSALLTGVVMFLVATATVFAWILTTQQVPQRLGDIVFSVSRDPNAFLAMSSLIFMLIGGLLDGVPAMLILLPIFAPMASAVGLNPLHFAIVMYTAINIGLFLPPIGVCFLLSCALGGLSMEKAVRAFLPYLVALVVGMVIVAAFPALTLFLPEVTGLAGQR